MKPFVGRSPCLLLASSALALALAALPVRLDPSSHRPVANQAVAGLGDIGGGDKGDRGGGDKGGKGGSDKGSADKGGGAKDLGGRDLGDLGDVGRDIGGIGGRDGGKAADRSGPSAGGSAERAAGEGAGGGATASDHDDDDADRHAVIAASLGRLTDAQAAAARPPRPEVPAPSAEVVAAYESAIQDALTLTDPRQRAAAVAEARAELETAALKPASGEVVARVSGLLGLAPTGTRAIPASPRQP